MSHAISRFVTVFIASIFLCGLAVAQNSSEVAQNTGYRDGLEKGRNDARQSKSFRLDRHDYYRNADHGYRSSFGNKEQYRQQYRDSFRRGYEEGYRGMPAERNTGQREVYVQPPNYSYGRRQDMWVLARDNGYRDGLEKGRNDAAEGKSARLERHDAYTDADRGYSEGLGDKDDYRQRYREAFRRGYDEGFRESQGRWRKAPDPGFERGERLERRGAAGLDVAENTGYRDGQGKGSNDARQGKAFSLERHDYYRDADHGYRSNFGDKESYKQRYRDAFRRGYEEGYRSRR